MLERMQLRLKLGWAQVWYGLYGKLGSPAVAEIEESKTEKERTVAGLG